MLQSETAFLSISIGVLAAKGEGTWAGKSMQAVYTRDDWVP